MITYKLEKILFYIFLFLIPFQIRALIRWNGNEWNSIFLYLTDILFLLVLGLWLKRRNISAFGGRNTPRSGGAEISQLSVDEISQPTADEISNFASESEPISASKASEFRERSEHISNNLIIFLIIAAVSVIPGIIVASGSIALAWFTRLVMFGLLFLYLRATLITNSTRMTRILQILIVSGVIQSILAIAQFIKQSSLGQSGLGIRFIEAGVFTPGAPGVATFVMENGDKIMRAYASFPHPNVLAGFLLLCIFCLYYLFLQKQLKGYSRRIQGVVLFVLIFGLFLTFSRTAIVVFLVMSLVMFLVYLIRRRRCWELSSQQGAKLPTLFAVFFISVIISVVILSPYLKSRFFNISFEEQAIDLRFFYNKMALTMIKEKPIFGIGIGNFVWHSQNYPAYLRAASKMMALEEVPSWIFQPVHNIYLLIAVEMGLVGLMVFLLFIAIRIIRIPIRMIRIDNPIFFLVICFLILGLADHYFWTLQSGGLMFWLALGLIHNS